MKKMTMAMAIVMILLAVATAFVPAQEAGYDPIEVRFARSKLPGECKEELMISPNALALIQLRKDADRLYIEYDMLKNRQFTGDDMRFLRPEAIGQGGNYVKNVTTNIFGSLGFMRRHDGDYAKGGLIIDSDSILNVMNMVALQNIREEGMISYYAKNADGEYTYGRTIILSISKEVIAECLKQELTEIIKKDETPTQDTLDLMREIERIRSLLDQNPIIQNS
jgi:hypothetical protein